MTNQQTGASGASDRLPEPEGTVLVDDLPDAVRRARDYAAIFLKAGHRWPSYVPVDGQLDGDRLHLQGVTMWHEGDAWHIDDGEGGHWAYRSAETAPAAADGVR